MKYTCIEKTIFYKIKNKISFFLSQFLKGVHAMRFLLRVACFKLKSLYGKLQKVC